MEVEVGGMVAGEGSPNKVREGLSVTTGVIGAASQPMVACAARQRLQVDGR